MASESEAFIKVDVEAERQQTTIKMKCGATSKDTCEMKTHYCMTCNDCMKYEYGRTCQSCEAKFHNGHDVLIEETFQKAEKMFKDIQNGSKIEDVGSDEQLLKFKNAQYLNYNLLHIAAKHNNVSFLDTIFKNEEGKPNIHRQTALKAINEKDRFGDTPLAKAVRDNSHDAMKTLLSNGAKITQDVKEAASDFDVTDATRTIVNSMVVEKFEEAMRGDMVVTKELDDAYDLISGDYALNILLAEWIIKEEYESGDDGEKIDTNLRKYRENIIRKIFDQAKNDDELKGIFECHHWMQFEEDDITMIEANLKKFSPPEASEMRKSIGMFLLTNAYMALPFLKKNMSGLTLDQIREYCLASVVLPCSVSLQDIKVAISKMEEAHQNEIRSILSNEI